MIAFGDWTVEVTAAGEVALRHQNGLLLDKTAPRLDGSDTVWNGACAQVRLHDAGTGLTYRWPGHWELDVVFEAMPDSGWLKVRPRLTNLSSERAALDTVSLCWPAGISSEPAFDCLLRHGKDLCDLSKLHPLEGVWESHACAGFTDRRGSTALALGFARHDHAFTVIRAKADLEHLEKLEAVVLRENVPIGAGGCVELPDLIIGAGESLSTLMKEYAAFVGDQMNARRPQPVETGWCSWYYYYGTESEADILKNLELIANSPLKQAIRVFQLDDGWNLPTPDHARVWGDWYAGSKFPRGMKAVADDIKAAGYIPGLWLAPFSVEKASDLFKEHPDWMVQGEDGPAEYWGIHTLDLTHPGALDFVRTTFERVFNEWGYDYVKIDFLMHAVQPGKRQDPTQTTAQAFRNGMRVIREVAGDRFVLNCGAPIAQSVGLCDAMRIGYDISSRWSLPNVSEGWPMGNCNVRAGALQTIWRQWMHMLWWQNDPDCLLVRDFGSEPEKRSFRDQDKQLSLENYPYGLSDEEAGFWVRLVWLTGTMALLSERIDELSPERMELLEQAFPLNSNPARWVDWYVNPQISIMQSNGDGHVVGVFNLGDESECPSVPARKLGLNGNAPWRFRERISGEEIELEGDMVQFPALPPHAGRVWERL